MRQFVQMLRRSAPGLGKGGGWVQQLATGAYSGMPMSMLTPTAHSLEGSEQNAFGRLTRGSAGVAELVNVMETQAWETNEQFNHFLHEEVTRVLLRPNVECG